MSYHQRYTYITTISSTSMENTFTCRYSYSGHWISHISLAVLRIIYMIINIQIYIYGTDTIVFVHCVCVWSSLFYSSQSTDWPIIERMAIVPLHINSQVSSLITVSWSISSVAFFCGLLYLYKFNYLHIHYNVMFNFYWSMFFLSFHTKYCPNHKFGVRQCRQQQVQYSICM